MKTVSAEKALASIKKYLSSDIHTPFFVVVDDETEYSELKNKLSTLSVIRTSDFCSVDSFPNMDALCDKLSAATQNVLLFGLGESLSLCGNHVVLGKLKTLTIQTKVVILCRGIRKAIGEISLLDKKFDSRHVCFLKNGLLYDIAVISADLMFAASEGFQELLHRLESGAIGVLYVKTELTLSGVKVINSAYDAIKQINQTFPLSQTCLNDEEWIDYLKDQTVADYDLLHFRTFLKLKLESSENAYLRYVVDKSTDYTAYKKRIFDALLDFTVSDKKFAKMYSLRKAILREFKDADISEYVTKTIEKEIHRISYLTDNTGIEQRAIIECLCGKTSIPASLNEVYPALGAYLRDYTFDGENGTLLTEYFYEYKRLKLRNTIAAEFYGKVLDYAIDGNRPYNALKTRGVVLERIDKTNSTLYWVDALGAEYLGFIQYRANELGLKIIIHTARANLPTITTPFNNDFYAAWSGYKTQTKDLDDIKHKGKRDFNYELIKLPVHLAEELRIIDDVLDWIKIQLAGKKTDKVIVVSDHGASRLAVINEKENKHEMVSKGEHSGRCCPTSEGDVKSEYATDENSFWVLANYDRFKGGRKASVEVHGGATLEEVVVPLIEVTLFDNKIEVTNTTPLTIASHRKKAEIILFSTSALKKVSVVVFEKRYPADSIGNNKHKIIFPDLRLAKKYFADVFEGDNLIGQVEFEIEKESGKETDLFL